MHKFDSERRYLKTSTFFETVANMIKGGVPAGVALYGLSLMGINKHDAVDVANSTANEILQGGGPLIAGLIVGTAENALTIGATLWSLRGKTEAGNYIPSDTEVDGTKVFQITCVDGRREDKNGGAIPGGYGPLGGEATGLLIAGLIHETTPDSIGGKFSVGYFIGRNILTTIYSHYALLSETLTIAHMYPKDRIKILVKDHFEGCGAEGFTNILSYMAKFVLHSPRLADIFAAPNEIGGYTYTNLILSPAVALITGWRVSLAAVSEHSAMNV